MIVQEEKQDIITDTASVDPLISAVSDADIGLM
jgi:hypothetical protein